jgi:hypothetical protein
MYRLVLGSAFPLAVAFAVMVAPTYASKPPDLSIQIQDQCDPTTFNSFLGPGVCTPGHGNVSFATFLTQIQNTHRAPQWRFVPDELHVKLGQAFTATNAGGENHTFTEVTDSGFGGGFVPLLNNATGLTTPASACAASGLQDASVASPLTFQNFGPGVATSLVGPGASLPPDTPGVDDVGHPNLYQCCIHPWMHEVITVDP